MRIPITPIREEISRILDSSENNINIPGIKLVEKRNPVRDHHDGFNCFRYCFMKEKEIWINVLNLPRVLTLPVGGYSEVKIPHEGDLAVYVSYTKERGLDFSHVGRMSTEGKVISKFNYGDVYLHSPELVPWEYGEMLKFYRKNSS